MEGMRDTGGSGDTFAGIVGVGIVDIQFDSTSLGPKGWFRKKLVGGKLVGLTVYYDTPYPARTGYYAAEYRVHWMGPHPDWVNWEIDDNDNGAGNDRNPVDMVQVTICKA
ncbi:MAG: hypothetical protein Q4D23_11010 [Bacteroidales bacterium]|nr:hypothetical protein [Bacteroidales bacterium]